MTAPTTFQLEHFLELTKKKDAIAAELEIRRTVKAGKCVEMA